MTTPPLQAPATAAPLADWVAPWATANKLASSAYTVGPSPFAFNTTSSNNAYIHSGSINWVKSNSTYTVGWVSQVTTNVAPVTTAQFQQWVQPKWVAADPNSFAVYYCSTATTSTGTTASSANYVSTKDLQTTLGTQSTTTTGLQAADTKNQVWRAATWTQATLSFACMGARDTSDTGTQFTAIKLGQTITFRAGFDYFRDTTTPAVATSTSTVDYTFSLVDSSASSGSVWIISSLTAVAMSVAVSMF